MPELTTEEIVQHVLGLAHPLLAQAGLELIELKVGKHKNDVLISVTADRLLGGITIQECAGMNKSLTAAVDQAGVLPLDCYALEFASPGLDRPLTTLKDFQRNLNGEVCFSLQEPVEGKRQIVGVVLAANEFGLTVFTTKKKELVIPLANVAQGMLVI